jgi:hypothetical protein
MSSDAALGHGVQQTPNRATTDLTVARAPPRHLQTPVTHFGPGRERERLFAPECKIVRRYGTQVRGGGVAPGRGPRLKIHT